MIAVGDKRAKIVHGDNHPAAFYKGDKLISGYQLKDLQGSGNVGIDAPYDAVLKSVSVDGLGEQDSLVGKNLFDMDAEKTDFSEALYKYEYTLKPNTPYTLSNNLPFFNSIIGEVASVYFNGTSSSNNGVSLSESVTESTDSQGNLYILVRYTNDGLLGSVNAYEGLKNGKYWMQLELGEVATPYEPYCGAMPAPNPVYPIQPQFLGGASLVCKTENHADESVQLPILRALPNGVHDEIDIKTGVITRRVGVYEVNSSHITSSVSTSFYAEVRVDTENNWKDFSGVCTHYRPAVNIGKTDNTFVKTDVCYFNDYRGKALDVTAVKQWLDSEKAKGTPVTIWYEYKEPVMEQVAPTLFKQHVGYTQLLQQGGFKDTNIKMTAYEERD